MSEKHFDFGPHKKLVILGYGSIGQAVVPLILKHISLTPQQITIFSKNASEATVAKKWDVNFIAQSLNQVNYDDLLKKYLNSGDFLVNLCVDVSSEALIKWCQHHQVLYLDTCIEPWAGVYTDSKLPPTLRSNYALRESIKTLKNAQPGTSTALITHGANPGLVSHFVKQALLNMAKDSDISVNPKTQTDWANLAQQLSIKVIHIAERDTQVANKPKQANEFVNTWSVDGFIAEGSQPAELGWGSHERHWPHDGLEHEFGTKCAIYLNRPGAATKVRTWTPLAGPFHGFLITHNESISIADYLTVKQDQQVSYRPTVHYAYHPCEDAVLSLHELAGREWQQQSQKRILFDEIVDGIDELGVLLMGNSKGAYWYGSQLSIQEARTLAPHNTATSLQVAIGVLSGMLWCLQHPEKGIVEPDEIDHEFILAIAKPYLGKVVGSYTDWSPLKERAQLFPETVDLQDPWQFINMRVM